MALWWGLVGWLAVGIGAALLLRLLPPWRPLGLWLCLAGGILGALAGGVGATLLGFGGLAALDPRSAVTAALAALLGLLLLALARPRDRSAQRSRRS